MGNYHARFLEGFGHGDMPLPTQPWADGEAAGKC